MSTASQPLTGERADFAQTLAKHRQFLRFTSRDLTDEQAAERTTASELCLGGIIKHVTSAERQWARFIVEGPSSVGSFEDAGAMQDWLNGFKMLPGETLAGLPDLDAAQPLPVAPWYEPGASWTARRVLLHIIAETAQHAGHADIIRESIDGAKTMG